jgi:aminoglycoside 3-N-acetyltransferase I
MWIERLTIRDIERARALFLMMAEVFETDARPLSDEYLARLLGRGEFWALAASVDGRTVGGLTAHALPMTRIAESEVLIYDIAVLPRYQRQGIGRQLMTAMRAEASAAGMKVVWVPADNEDTHALDFYRALGGEPAAVTIFTFGGGEGAP